MKAGLVFLFNNSIITWSQHIKISIKKTFLKQFLIYFFFSFIIETTILYKKYTHLILRMHFVRLD